MPIDMVFARLRGVMVCMRRMAMGRVRVVCSSDMVSGLALSCCFAVMARRVLVMFGGGTMMVFGGRVRMVHLVFSQLNWGQ